MSMKFRGVMNEINDTLKSVYKSDACVLVPGGGSFAMEAVARQFATNKKCLVIRNGWFSFRWTQILDMCKITASHQVLKARRVGEGPQAPFAPCPIEEVVATINAEKPEVVFAPHVETSSGIILPNDYIKAMSDAVHANGGLFVLDCVASGCIWIDMAGLGVDVLITAPQKGWSSPPSCGIVMLGPLGSQRLMETESSSFCMDLKKWSSIMGTYTGGAHGYHATMPTDALVIFNNTMKEMCGFGVEACRDAQQKLGDDARTVLEAAGYPSVAAPGFRAPGVVVSYTTDADIKSGKKFTACGMQIAAGVPLQVDEGADYMSFRIGLFGADKLKDVDGTVKKLETALKAL
jgi:aspartate aminotransferase-like enzyme